MEEKRKNRGVTLIALAITVIILVILVAISITSFQGDDDVISEATEAKILTNLSTVDEAYQIYLIRNSELTQEDMTDILQKVTVESSGESIQVIKNLEKLKIKKLGDYGKGTISDKVNKITQLDNLYIVDEEDNVSYVLKGKIYGDIELGKNIEEYEELTKFFTFNEETGAITGIVQNKTKDPNGIGWYYDGPFPETAKKIFSYKKDTLSIPKVINGKAVTSITQKGTAEKPDSDFSGNLETTIHLIIPEGITSIDGGTFTNCQWINEVTLPSTLERIEDYTFQNCKNLKKVNFSENNKINYIGKHAFCQTGIEELVLPKEITNVCDSAFERTHLRHISFLAPKVNFDGKNVLAFIHENLEVELPSEQDNLTCDGMFSCSDIMNLALPTSLRELGYHTLGSLCVEKVDMEKTGVQVIPQSCFGWGLFKEIVLPEKLLKIEEHAFVDCKSLNEIRIPITCSEIADDAFDFCTNLTKIILKQGTTLQVPEDKWGATNAAIEYEP